MNPAMTVLRTALIARRQGSIVTIDDVRAELAAEGVGGNHLGGYFRSAVRRGWLTPVGYVTVQHEAGRGRAVRQYRRNAISSRGAGPKPRRVALFDLTA